MTYSSGNTIIDDDYNLFAHGSTSGTPNTGVDSVNRVFGTDNVDNYGYGQTDIDPVNVGTTISATQWATLLTKMTSAANHSGTSITAISNPSAGDTISAYAALSANIIAINGSPARLNAHGNGADSTSTTVTTDSWAGSASQAKTFTWSSDNAMRYFFNAGGMLRLSWSRSGGTASSQNTAWSNLLTASGTIVITGSAASKTIAAVSYTGITKIGGSGTPSALLTGTGVLDAAGTVTIFSQVDTTASYTSNTIAVTMNVGTGTISIGTTLTDPYSNGAPVPGPDAINGTLTQTNTIRYPSTTYLADTWGTVTVNSPTWALA